MKNLIIILVITIIILLYILNKNYNLNENDVLNNIGHTIENLDKEKYKIINNKNNIENRDKIIKSNLDNINNNIEKEYLFSDNYNLLEINDNDNFKISASKLFLIYNIITKLSIKTDIDVNKYINNNIQCDINFYDYYNFNSLNPKIEDSLNSFFLYMNTDKNLNSQILYNNISDFIKFDFNNIITNNESENIIDILNGLDIKENKNLFEKYLVLITNTINDNKKRILENLENNNKFRDSFLSEKFLLNKFIIVGFDKYITNKDIINLILILINCYYYKRPIILFYNIENIKYESNLSKYIFNYIQNEIKKNNKGITLHINDNDINDINNLNYYNKNKFKNEIKSFLSKYKSYM